MSARPRLLAVAAAALVVTLAGCGGAAPQQVGANGSPAVTVAAGSGAAFAPLTTQAAAEGLTITTQRASSGAAAIPLLLNGQLQFAATDTVGALTAISKGVPLVIVAMAATGGTSAADDATGILVKDDSIADVADLVGKKVAVNGIGNIAQLSAAAAIDKLGGDSRAVKFVEIPPRAMVAAVVAGTVDAAVTSEPGVTDGKASGLRNMLSPMSQAIPSAPLFVYVTSQSYLAEHRDVVLRFARNMAAANTFASEHPEFVRQYAAKSAKLSPEQLRQMILPQFIPVEVQKPALQDVVDLMFKYTIISQPVDLDKAILTP